MIRYLHAFAWLRWRILLNGLKGSRRRDLLERISRAAAVLAPALLVIPFGIAAVLLAWLGFHAGRNLGVGGSEAGKQLLVARGILLLVLLLPVLVPLGRATRTSRSGAARLLLLPIPRRALHLAETLATLADPWLGFVVPGLLLFAAGLVTAGRVPDGILAVGAGLAFLAAVGSLAALAAFATDWVMRDRRRGEVFTLLFVLVLSVVGLLPALYAGRFEDHVRGERREKRARAFSVESFDEKLPVWTRALPSELYARAVLKEVEGRPETAWLLVGALAGEAAVIFGLSSLVHRRVLDPAGSGRSRRRASEVRPGAARWPFLSPAATAVAVVHARNALRSVRGRLAILLPGPMFAGLALLARRMPDEIPLGGIMGSRGHALLGFQSIFALYALQAFHLNQFASDRAGLSLHFLSPISDVDLVKGKAAGGAVIYAVSLGLCLVCASLVATERPDVTWLSVLLGAISTYALLAPGAAALSAIFPKTADLSRTGSGGNPHGFSVLIGTLAVAVLAAPTGVALALVGDWMGRDGLALALIAGWTLVTLVAAPALLRLVAALVASRRENLALVAGGR